MPRLVRHRGFEVLDPSHPVAVAAARAARFRERAGWLAAAGVAVTGVLIATGRPGATAFAVLSSIVGLGFGLSALLARAEVRAAAVDAIADGADHGGVRELDVARQLLEDPRHRARIADALSDLASAEQCDDVTRRELIALAQLLRDEAVLAPRAVALCWRLAAQDTALLAGGDATVSGEELRRVRYLAASGRRDPR